MTATAESTSRARARALDHGSFEDDARWLRRWVNVTGGQRGRPVDLDHWIRNACRPWQWHGQMDQAWWCLVSDQPARAPSRGWRLLARHRPTRRPRPAGGTTARPSERLVRHGARDATVRNPLRVERCRRTSRADVLARRIGRRADYAGSRTCRNTADVASKRRDRRRTPAHPAWKRPVDDRRYPQAFHG